MLPLFIAPIAPKHALTPRATSRSSSRTPLIRTAARTKSSSSSSSPRTATTITLSMDERDRATPNDAPPSSSSSTRGVWFHLKLRFNNAMSQRRKLNAGVLRNYGIAAFLAYGFFDALTYSISFLISLRAYLAAGKILTWKTLPQVLAIMWGINNFSRPFRVAGALALAPVVDRRIVKPLRNFFTRLRSPSSTSQQDE